MPGVRDPNKNLASFWMHKDIYTALGIVTKVSDTTLTRYVLEALADKMGFTLDANGHPVGLDLDAIARKAFEQRKRPQRRKKAT
ncbi:MAG: hypothetical protein NTZ46_08325 [Verrucomicrobia bacterium]|nr:hypothetical protein [Verrucomicrobiota bacterium]